MGMTEHEVRGWPSEDLIDRVVDAVRDANAEPWPTHLIPADRYARAALAVVASELPRMRTWDWLMAVLSEHYPPDVFTGSSGDPAPQIVALTREVDRLRREAEGAVVVGAAALDGELVDANEQLGLAVTEIGLAAGLPAGTSAAVIRDEVGRLRRLEQLGGQS